MGISIYQLQRWLKMLTGKSISHVNQGKGTCFLKNSVAGYYNDLTEKVLKRGTKTEIPLVSLDNKHKVIFPIEVFQYGLGAYDLYLLNNSEQARDIVLKCGEWALSNQNSDGSWNAFSHKTPDSPFSSMAQGEGGSLLLRTYLINKDPRYLSASKLAIDYMLTPISEGGTAKYENGLIYLFECPNEDLILNGWFFSAWGVLDYFLISKDNYYGKIWDAVVQSIVCKLPEFDCKYWSKYNLGNMICSPFYHRLHIAQLEAMFDLTDEKIFLEYRNKWSRYLKNPVFKGRAFIKKVVQKIAE